MHDIPPPFIYTAAELIAAAISMALIIWGAERWEKARPKKRGPWDKDKRK